MKPYKGRKTSVGDKVELYRNLHTNGFSVRCYETKLVLAHTDQITLENCEFHVQENVRKKSEQRGVRSVHAWITGVVSSFEASYSKDEHSRIYYNPFKTKTFVDAVSQKPLLFASEVHFLEQEAYFSREGAIL